jgi:ubiquinone/menaquinone biosynthesis C-methylase UbiE
VPIPDEIWQQVPSDRPIDPAAVDFARETVRSAKPPVDGKVRVLDLGCGDGRVTAQLAYAGTRITGADPSSVALERARAAHDGIEFKATSPDGALPFADNSFDAVVCLNVLQHVADTQRLLSETRRVLAPAGLVAVAVPFHGVLKNLAITLGSFERHHDPLEPVLRFYTKRSLMELLEQFGFYDVRLETTGGFPLVRETLLARTRRGGP